MRQHPLYESANYHPSSSRNISSPLQNFSTSSELRSYPNMRRNVRFHEIPMRQPTRFHQEYIPYNRSKYSYAPKVNFTLELPKELLSSTTQQEFQILRDTDYHTLPSRSTFNLNIRNVGGEYSFERQGSIANCTPGNSMSSYKKAMEPFSHSPILDRLNARKLKHDVDIEGRPIVAGRANQNHDNSVKFTSKLFDPKFFNIETSSLSREKRNILEKRSSMNTNSDYPTTGYDRNFKIPNWKESNHREKIVEVDNNHNHPRSNTHQEEQLSRSISRHLYSNDSYVHDESQRPDVQNSEYVYENSTVSDEDIHESMKNIIGNGTESKFNDTDSNKSSLKETDSDLEPRHFPGNNSKPINTSDFDEPNASITMESCKICGRNFDSSRISKHAAICNKNKTRVSKVGLTASKPQTAYADNQTKQGDDKKSNWRRKHEELIDSLREAKKVQAYINKGGKPSDLPPPKPSVVDGKPCPHCLRIFNENSYEKHVEICERLKQKGRPTKMNPKFKSK